MSTPHDSDSPLIDSPPRDELDDLLRAWHADHAERAADSRERLLASLSSSPDGAAARDRRAPHLGATARAASDFRPAPAPHRTRPLLLFRKFIMNRYTRVAASLIVLVTVITLLIPSPGSSAYAAQEVMVPEGGRLDAIDEHGGLIGPCPLTHTDVVADISGHFARVTLTQQYQNPYDRKIEAVYTFPLSHGGAVDRMTMTVGDRVVVGEVKERGEARRIYEAAKDSNYVASLLEQERPNIFTQSVANIEPGAAVTVEISYVEVIEPRDGEYAFDFPMVVAPRYIPGAPIASPAVVPAELNVRRGVTLLGPAQLTLGEPSNVDALGALQVAKLQTLLSTAQPIEYPGAAWWGSGDAAKVPDVWYPFEAAYGNGSKELGWLYVDGTGQINGRWFYTDPAAIRDMGAGFHPDTNQVPDASRITPMPALPGKRAGHDISVTVNIDSGGPAIISYESDLHEVTEAGDIRLGEPGPKLSLVLATMREIPNRDFVLRWKLADDRIQEAHLAHVGQHGDESGGFFTLMLQPPARVDDADARPRELVFVLDTSGSMRGFPIEKAKEVMTRAIDAMRPRDTFNLITFSGDTHILWAQPRPATEANRAEARAFVESRQGRGGTEMMSAIEAALRQEFPIDAEAALSPARLADLPADGRGVEVVVEYVDLEQGPGEDEAFAPLHLRVRDDLAIAMRPEVGIPAASQPKGAFVRLTGRWATKQGRRVLIVDRAELAAHGDAVPPMRICMFLTDGQVGNDQAIIDAVRANHATTRVFSFGIGDSPNRFLLDGMADAGRGEVAYVNLESDAAAAVQRFAKRIATPVLTDITLTFGGDIEVADTVPALDDIPDLFDVKPLVIHGRYTPGKETRRGTLTIRGLTGAGPYERTIDLELPADAPEHDVIATLWARSRVDELTKTDDRDAIIAIGESFQIMTAYTSFVAVEKTRITIDGEPMLVAVPIEMPEGQSWEGTFGIPDPEQLVDAGADTNGAHARHAVLRRTIETLKNTVNPNGVLDISETGQVAQQIRIDLGQAATERTAAGYVFSMQLGEAMHAMEGAESTEQMTFAWQSGVPTFTNAPELDVDTALESGSKLVADKFAAIPVPPGYFARTEGKQGDQFGRGYAPANGAISAGRSHRGRTVAGGAYVTGPPARPPLPHSGIAVRNLADAKEVFVGAKLGLAVESEAAGVRRSKSHGAAPGGGGGGDDLYAGGSGGGTFGGSGGGALDVGGGGGGGGLRDSTDSKQVEQMARRRRLARSAEQIDRQVGALTSQLQEYSISYGTLDEDRREAEAHQIVNLERRLEQLEARRGALVEQLSELGGPIQAPAGELPATGSDAAATNAPSPSNPLIDIIIENVHPEAWDDLGGDLATIREDERGRVVVEALQDTDEARQVVADAEAMLKSLQDQWTSSALAPFAPPEVIILIGAFVDADRHEDAILASDWLVLTQPDFDLAAAAHRALIDESLTDEQRDEQMHGIVGEAERLIADAIEALRRSARLQRVLDVRFRPLLAVADLPVETMEVPDFALPAGLTWHGGGLLVTLLTSDATDATRDALREAGLRIDSVTTSNVVVGSIPPGKLVDLALLEFVRRVEPVSLK